MAYSCRVSITYPAKPAFQDEPQTWGDAWTIQPKFNGWRALVHITDGAPELWNRHGERLTIADNFTAALMELCRVFPTGTWLDCEALERRGSITGTLVVFDVVMDGTHSERMAWLANYMTPLAWNILPASNSAVLCGTVPATEARKFFTTFAKINAKRKDDALEGAVAKRKDSIYPVQLTTPHRVCNDWQKFRIC